MKLNDVITEAEKVRLDPKCWTGKKIGTPKTKVKGGVRVNNCVPAESVAEGMLDNPGAQDSPVAQAITRRILMQRTDLLAKHGPEKVGQAVDEVADFVGDVDEIGSSDVSGWVRHVEQMLGNMDQGVAEGWPGELAGGTIGGIAGNLVGSAVGGPIGGVVAGAVGGAGGGIIGRELTKEEQLNELAPILAAGARLVITLAPKIAQVLKNTGKATAKAAAPVAKSGAEIAAKNAGRIGVGLGAYEIGSSVADIAKDITAKVGTALEEKTVMELAQVAFKFAIPAGIVLAILYGGKKVIDSLFNNSNPQQGVAEGEKKPHPETWHDVDPKLGRAVDKMSQAEKVKKGLAHPDTLKKKGVAEGSDPNTQSHADAFKSETNTMKPGTSKYVGRKGGKEVTAKKDEQGNVKFYHRDGIKGPLKRVNEMDKSQTPPGRSGASPDSGKEYTAKPIKANDFAKDAGDQWIKNLSKDQLDAIAGPRYKKKGVAEDYNAEYDDEAGMADNNLETLARAVQGIDELIQSGDNLPEWCQEKIAVAKSMLVAVWDYMYSEEASDEVDPEVDEMFEAMDQLAEEIAARDNIDVDLVWESFESLDDHMLYETAAWRRKEGKSKTGGLNAKGVASYRRENPGSKLQTAVTTKPSKLKPGSKAAKRRKSFCARMSGVKGPMKKPNGKPTRKALALRKWNC